jgi:hypothetical protein
MDFDVPHKFEEAVKERRLVPFIGAGFSKNVHKDFPNWSEVVTKSAELLEYDADILSTQGDYLQIAEYLSIKRRLGDLYNVLAKQIDNDSYDVMGSRAHLLLPYLDVQSIFTTNWDSWIERGFENQKVPYSKIITNADFIFPRTYRPRFGGAVTPLYPPSAVKSIRQKFKETTIVKYHGDFADHDSIVFRESHYYDRLDFEHPLDIKLRAEIIGRSVLFIGYSFSDPNVRYIWHKLNKAMQDINAGETIKSYFVTHLNNPLLIEVFRTKNIETILLSPKSIKTDLEELFEYIIELQQK